MLRRSFLLPTLICLGLIVPATALGGVRSGSGSDPADDAEPQFDIRRASVTYKTNGRVTATISLAAAPQPGSLIAAAVDTSARSSDCFSDNALGLGFVPGKDAFALLGTKTLKATAKVKGKRVTISTRGPKVARQPWDCATAAAGPEDASIASDLLDRPVRLKSR